MFLKTERQRGLRVFEQAAANVTDTDSNNPDERDIVVLGGTVAIALGVMYWALRVGFDNPKLPVINSVALSLFLLVFPHVVRGLAIRLRRGAAEAWYLTYPFLWLCGILVSAILGFMVPVIGFNSFDLLLGIGIGGFAITLALWLRDKGAVRAVAYLVSAAAFGVWSGGVVWGRIYKNPLFVESLINDGTAHHDTLHLAALGNMLRTYHTASIGIDGLVYEPYHWGSAWLFVQWANLVSLDVLHFYQLAFPVIGIPLFFSGVALFGLFMRDRRLPAAGELVRRSGWKFWILLLVVSIGFMPIGGLDAMGVWTSNVLISESYTIAVPVALLLAATAFVFAQNLTSDGAPLATAPLGKIDLFYLFVFLPLSVGALGYLKISLMVLWFAASAFFMIRLGLFRRTAYLVSFALSAAAFFFVYPRVSLPAHREGFVPFDFLWSFVPPQWWPFYLFIHLLWTWVYVAVRLRREKILTLGDLRAAVGARQILDVELVVGVALLGIIPGLVIHIDGGSAFYFSDVQRWLAAGLLLSLVAARVKTQLPNSKSGIGSWPTSGFLKAFVLIAVVGSALSNAIHWPLEMVRRNVEVRSALYARAGHPVVIARVRDFWRLKDPAILSAALIASPNYATVSALEKIQELPLDVRRRTALFIPQDEKPYWTMLTQKGACTFDSFVAPALATVALIEGTPAFGCTLNKYYGLGSYPARTRAETEADKTPQALCARAERMGADRVMVLRFPIVAAMPAPTERAVAPTTTTVVSCKAPT